MIALEDLYSIDDPFELFELTTRAIAEHQEQIDQFAEIRARAIAALHAQGRSYKELASQLGISAPRIGQLVNANDAAAMQVLRAYVSLERVLSEVAELEGSGRIGPPVSKAIKVMKACKVVDDRLIHDIDEIRRVRNGIVHGQTDVGVQEAEEILNKIIYLNARITVLLHEYTQDRKSKQTRE